MKRFLLYLAVVLFAIYATSALAANDVKVNDKGTIITITGLDEDLQWSTESDLQNLTHKIKIIQIKFIPSATNDRFIIYDRQSDGTIEGPAFFDTGKIADAYDVKVDSMGGGVSVSDPWIDITDCIMTTAADCKLIIIIER